MNKDQWAGRWKQLEGGAKRTWGKLTDDDWAKAAGDLDAIAGRIQERYGDAKEAVMDQLARLYTSAADTVKARVGP
jgi:uncharacterized protein YjbJ (UPF0337 family)